MLYKKIITDCLEQAYNLLNVVEDNNGNYLSGNLKVMSRNQILSVNGLNIWEYNLPEKDLIKILFDFYNHYYTNKLLVKILLNKTLVAENIPFVINDYKFSSIVIEKYLYLKIKDVLLKFALFINENSRKIDAQYSKIFQYPKNGDKQTIQTNEYPASLIKYKKRDFPYNSKNLNDISNWLDKINP